jgi:hypothetical protein
MHLTVIRALGLASAAAVGSLAGAQSTGSAAAPRFAEPRRIQAGDRFLGEGRYYPSPVLHDVDGDGRCDLVIGDLMGKVTWAPREAGTEPAFGAEVPLQARNGQPLKFHNW